MSKKSIRSKGYRKSAKKPYLSKRDILIVVGVIAVIVIGIVLFNLLYDDGSLDVVDGVAQVQGENSLLINAGSANNPRYYKLGQLADIEEARRLERKRLPQDVDYSQRAWMKTCASSPMSPKAIRPTMKLP